MLRGKIAVIFFGQPRYISSKLASKSHKWWLRKCDVDYFGHCWFHSSISIYRPAHWTGLEHVNVPMDTPELILKQYPGCDIKFEKPVSFDLNLYRKYFEFQPGEILSDKLTDQIKGLEATLSQSLSIHRAFEHFTSVADVEAYDFIILSRYDNFIWKMKRPEFLPKDKLNLSNHHPGFPDLIFIGSWRLISSLDSWPNLHILLKNNRNFSSENLKKESFKMLNTEDDLNAIFSDIAIIRGTGLRYNCIKLVGYRLRRVFQIRTRLNLLFKCRK